MKKLQLKTRQIGTVSIFDLEGVPTRETLQDVATRIQKRIRRHRLQRIILNLQYIPVMDQIEVRQLLTACLRPKRSLIYGASEELVEALEQTYSQPNVLVCGSEEQVAEDLGPFLLEKETSKEVSWEPKGEEESIGSRLERRRSKRMHVAMPVEFTIGKGEEIEFLSRAIITNISEGGLFAEYLNLDEAEKLENYGDIVGNVVSIRIPPCKNFPEEYRVTGVVTRKETRRGQLGIAIEFKE